MRFNQNKKSFELALTLIVSLFILLLGAGVLLAATRYTASKINENFQVATCRTLNEFKFGLKEKSNGLLTSGSSICNTIDKQTNEKTFVPTEKYKQDKEGAETEIREMIKNCWYMWLDGSKPNMFKQLPFSEGCFTCYTFKIKKDINGVTYNSLKTSMENPYYAKDTSDKCAPNGGGYWRQQKCGPDEKEAESRNFNDPNYKCCVKEDLRNVCENQGGRCISESAPPTGYSLYFKWSCPKYGQICYVPNDGLYSYTRYIRDFNKLGGEIFFMPPNGEQATDVTYAPGGIYAVNFISPSRQFCYKSKDAGAGCYAAIGGYALAAPVAVAGGIYTLVALGPGAIAGGALKTLSMIGIGGSLGISAAYQTGTLGGIAIKGVDWALGPITDQVYPNTIMVSTLDDAKRLGCKISYGG